MSAAPKLKIAIVGAGVWGRQHARVFTQRPDVELVGIVSRRPERAAERAAEFKTRGYTDIPRMLAEAKPDLVSLSLPNLEHFPATREIIAAGVPLLVEKPLVFELAEADELLREAEERKLFFAINFNHRYARPIRMARAAIEQERLGEIIYATSRFGGEANISPHPHANLIETQCHAFDQLEYLCGPIASVATEMTNRTGGGYRSLVIALRFRNGGVGSLVGTYDSSYAYRDTHRLEINGTKGRIVVEDTVKRYSFQQTGNETAEVWEAGYFNDYDREFHRTFDTHLDAVLTAFKAGQPPPIHARAGRRALELAWAAVSSFETGRRVEVA